MQWDELKLVRRARILAVVSAVGTMLLSSSVIAGWLFEIDFLHPFKPVTAIAILLTSLSMLCLHPQAPGPTRRITGLALALAAATAACLDLSQFAWQWGFRWDSVVSEYLLHGEDFAFFGGMSPNDAVVILIVSAAMVSLAIPNKIFELISQILAVASLLAAMMTLLGCIFGVADFCLFISCLRISVLSGLCMTLSAVSILLSRPHGPLTSILVSPDAGGMIARVLFPAALGIPPLLGWIRVLGEQAHIFNTESSLSVIMVIMLLIFMSLIWWMSFRLDRSDRQRKQTMMQLAASEKRNRLTVQQAIDAFIAVDDQGIIRDWNYRAERTFGHSKEEALGKAIFDLILPDGRRADSRLWFKQFAASHRAFDKPVEYAAVDAAGREFPIELSVFPIDVDDELVFCGFVRDITERKLIEQRFHDFYSNVSHELRSPLTSISGSMKLLESLFGEQITEKGLKLIGVAENSCQRLIRLINDLLDIRKMEAGRLAMKMHLCDAGELVKTATDGLEGMAAKSRVRLETRVDGNGKILADWDRMIQVLTNFTANAIKYSPPDGTVTVKLDLKESGILRFSVCDNGPGISQADQSRLFNKFEQVGGDSQKQGTGLGLVIARAIVEEHSGVVGIESEAGKGATFWFEIPGATAKSVDGVSSDADVNADADAGSGSS